jgi:GTPase SAR1 family protein
MREAAVNLVVGAKGYGKSTWLKNHLAKHPKRNQLVYKNAGRISDPAFSSFPLVPFYSYRGGRAKISDFDVEYREFIDQVYKHFKNGVVVVDDASFYEQDNITPELKRLIVMNRGPAIDVYLVFHGLSDVPIKLFSYINNIILFHTTDSFTYKKSKIPEMRDLQDAADHQAEEVRRKGKYIEPVVVKFS